MSRFYGIQNAGIKRKKAAAFTHLLADLTSYWYDGPCDEEWLECQCILSLALLEVQMRNYWQACVHKMSKELADDNCQKHFLFSAFAQLACNVASRRQWPYT